MADTRDIKINPEVLILETLKYWVGGQWGQSYLMGRRCLFGHPSSDGVTIKIPYEVDVLLHQPASHPIFIIIFN